jgi:hypothetical protein
MIDLVALDLLKDVGNIIENFNKKEGKHFFVALNKD